MYLRSVLLMFVFLRMKSPLIAQCLGVPECQCESLSNNAQIINCRAKELTDIPKFTENFIHYQELTLEGNKIQALKESSFRGLTLNSINLRGNPIVYISPTAFRGVEAHLKTLILGLNQSAPFPSTSLSGLLNLKSLHIYNFGGSSLPDNAFYGLNLLEELALLEGRLTNLAAPSLRVMTMLDSILLEFNRFSIIPVAALSAIPTLRKLSMKGNSINNLDANSFNFSSIIEEIDLSMNSLNGNIAPGAFSSLSNTLKYLTINDGQLTDTSMSAFASIKRLSVLTLQRNSITTIADNFFNILTGLLQLNIAENKITQLSENVFKGSTSSLMNINLGHNPISLTPLNVFTSLTNLETLVLRNVRSVALSSQSLAPMQKKLKSLDLSSSPIGESTLSALTPLVLLQELNLSMCSLKSLPDFTFEKNINLRTLDLSHNDITSISDNTFRGMEKSLTQLNLDSNKLTTLDRCTWGNLHYLDPLKLSIQGNPIKCDCNLRWLFSKVKNALHLQKLSWKCDDGTLFSSKEILFDQCPTSEDPCPNRNNGTYSGALILEIRKLTENSAELYWTVSGIDVIYGFHLDYETLNNPRESFKTLELPNALREYSLPGLNPSRKYSFCLKLLTSSGWPSITKSCKVGETLPASVSNIFGSAIGGVVGGIAFIVILLVVCSLLWKKKIVKFKETSENQTNSHLDESHSKQSAESVNYLSISSNREVPVFPGLIASGFDGQYQNNVLSFMLASRNANATALENWSRAGSCELNVNVDEKFHIANHTSHSKIRDIKALKGKNNNFNDVLDSIETTV